MPISMLSMLFFMATAAVRAVAGWSERPESELVKALVEGDEQAFSFLVRKHWRSMVRVATGLVRSEGVATEVVQETWEAVFKEIGGFRQEASLRNWIFRILVNRARRVGKKEARSIPFSELLRRDAEDDRRDVLDEFTAMGRWRSPVHGWKLLDPQRDMINKEGLGILAVELEKLPENQRVVVTMRDVEGLDSREVCELLEISEGNQRVLLHRGRTALRVALEAVERELQAVAKAAGGAK